MTVLFHSKQFHDRLLTDELFSKELHSLAKLSVLDTFLNAAVACLLPVIE